MFPALQEVPLARQRVVWSADLHVLEANGGFGRAIRRFEVVGEQPPQVFGKARVPPQDFRISADESILQVHVEGLALLKVDFGIHAHRFRVGDYQFSDTRQPCPQSPLGQVVVGRVESIESQPQWLPVGPARGFGAHSHAHAVDA